jgi:L-ornithine N5-oxygenase
MNRLIYCPPPRAGPYCIDNARSDNYLTASGRLFSFGLLDRGPGRIEWADYCRWVAAQLDDKVRYGHLVTNIAPVPPLSGRHVDLLRVTALELHTHEECTFEARNVVLCTGRRPNIPDLFSPLVGDRVFHSSSYLSSIAAWPRNSSATIAVIGAGQSAIEILLHLSEHYPFTKLISISRRDGFRLHDVGDFSNETYFPDAVDAFFRLPKQTRREVLQDAWHSNYSSVDAHTSHALYARRYEESISGVSRLILVKRSEVTQIVQTGSRLLLEIDNMAARLTCPVEVDAVILCTGYQHQELPGLLEPLRPYLVFDADGDFTATRDYELRTSERLRARVFINGLSELSYGVSDAASFSMIALKAEHTLRRLAGRNRHERERVDRIASHPGAEVSKV